METLARRLRLDGEPEEGVEEAWREEIARRVREVEEGKVELIPGEEVERELRELIAKKALRTWSR